MQITVQGVGYSIEDSIRRVSLNNLNLLRAASSIGGQKPLTLATIQHMMGKLRELGRKHVEDINAAKALAEAEGREYEDPELTVDDMLEDAGFLGEEWFLPNVMALIFVVWRAAGLPNTFEDAQNLPVSEWAFAPDPAPEVETPEVPEAPKELEAADDDQPLPPENPPSTE